MSAISNLSNYDLSQILSFRSHDQIKTKRTRVVCTMGPSCATVEKIVEMIDAGMNVCRLNFSHGDHTTHSRMVQTIREANRLRPHCHLAILLDTKGPEIRTGFLKNHEPIKLVYGQKLKICTDYTYEGDASCIACSYSQICTSVHPGNTIMVADGSLTLRVDECLQESIICTVMNDTILGEKKKYEFTKCKG